MVENWCFDPRFKWWKDIQEERQQQLTGEEVKTMIRIGRVIINPSEVSSVMRENGTGNPVKTTVFLKNGSKHEFDKYAQQAWDYFKGTVNRTIAG